MHNTVCQFSQLSQQFATTPVFSELSAALDNGLTGLVGRNGQGKSVLLSLLAEIYPPTGGHIHWFSPYHYVQQVRDFHQQRLADVLGVGELFDCFQRIQAGEAHEEDFSSVETSWHLPAVWEQVLAAAGLTLPLDAPARQLSGGQQTRLLLCRAFLQTDHYLLLDEPSNHLDTAGREWLLQQLARHPAGALIASHDRQLLQQVERILELDQQGLHEYGGNYALYQSVRATRVAATEQKLAALKKDQLRQKAAQQAALEKASQRRKQGVNQRRSGSQSKMLMDAQKQRAEGSLSKLKQQQAQRGEQLGSELQQTQSELDIIKPQTLRFAPTLSGHGLCLHLADLQLPHVQHPPLSMTVQQGERWQISGANGTGKSTLLRVIAGLESARSGQCEVQGGCVYLDQHFSLLETQISALENLQRLHPEASATDLRTELAGVRLRGDKALQPVATLSGGERLKVALLAVLMGKQLPALLLLDEPDNHLDLDSRLLLERTLTDYPGGLLVVSHDPVFIAGLGIGDLHQLNLNPQVDG